GLEDVIQLPYTPPDREHMFMLYPIIVRGGDKRGLVNFLEERGVETRDLLPLINQPIYVRMFGELESRFPVAKHLNHAGFYVGCHQYINQKDIDYLAATVRAYFGR